METLISPITLSMLIGKTIINVERMKHLQFDDYGFLRLSFSDNTFCVFEAGYGGWTGDSEDEYPTGLWLANAERIEELTIIHQPPEGGD